MLRVYHFHLSNWFTHRANIIMVQKDCTVITPLFHYSVEFFVKAIRDICKQHAHEM